MTESATVQFKYKVSKNITHSILIEDSLNGNIPIIEMPPEYMYIICACGSTAFPMVTNGSDEQVIFICNDVKGCNKTTILNLTVLKIIFKNWQ